MSPSASADGKCKPSVAVIGAGVSGLQALRSLKERQNQGHFSEVLCLDAELDVGGQWLENYSSLCTQVPKELYEFPGLQNKDVRWGKLAACAEVSQMCSKYADKFDLRSSIRFGTEVVQVDRDEESEKWKLTIRKLTEYKRCAPLKFQPLATPKGETFTLYFDYVVLATGPCSHREPFVPKVPGMDTFQAQPGKQILHSSCNVSSKNEPIESGKRVLVIGAGKSAYDSAIQACENNASETMQLMRRAHWSIPQKVLGLIPFEYFFCTRFGEALVHTMEGSTKPPVPYPTWRRILNFFAFPIGWCMIKSFELLFIFQLSLKGVWLPKDGFLKDVLLHGFTHPKRHQVLRWEAGKNKGGEGCIQGKIGEVVSYNERGVVIKEKGEKGGDFVEEEYECDIVIYATGFEHKYNIFPENLRSKLGENGSGLALYRQILHPEFKNLAFVGAEFLTFSHLESSSVQGEWVARWAAGDTSPAFQPTKEEMEREISAIVQWTRKHKPPKGNANAAVFQQINYQDTLLLDMGESRYRKMPNIFAEALMPYRPRNYKGVIGKPLKNGKGAVVRRVI